MTGGGSPGGDPAKSGAKTILFGGSGFLGPYILSQRPEMVSVGRSPPSSANPHLPIKALDDLSTLDDVEFDSVIYIVGNTDHHSLDREVVPRCEPTAYDYHTVPLLRVLEQLKGRRLRRFVHFSTVLIYDQNRLRLPVNEDAPIDPYRSRYVLSKYLAEEACRYYARWVPVVNIRMSNLYGPTPLERFDLIHVLCRQLITRGEGQVWSTAPSRDFIYVEDAARAVLDLLDTDYCGTLNLGTGVMTRVSEVVALLEEVSGLEIGDLGQRVPGPMEFRCDTATLERLIGWEPRWSVAQGVGETFRQMREWIEP
ncbi:MAG: NAD-dependent epimerase/dehydratase family protein [Acidimicrobiia bacterium]